MKYAERSSALAGRVHFKCVLASELDPDLRNLYVKNFPELIDTYSRNYSYSRWRSLEGVGKRKLGDLADSLDIFRGSLTVSRIHGDLNGLVDEPKNRIRRWPDGRPMVPEHDLLCAGFPCQPFSKSGAQRGFDDVNGTVFHLISIILAERRPGFVLLENVGNFERHDGGNTWKRVKEILGDLGYDFRATTHVGSIDGGEGLLSPHHVGLPHHRERFFVAAKHRHEKRVPFFDVLGSPFPERVRNSSHPRHAELNRKAESQLTQIIAASKRHATSEDFRKARVAEERLWCASHWQKLLDKIVENDRRAGTNLAKRIQPMPSFPIWGFELDFWNQYPIRSNPKEILNSRAKLNNWRQTHALKDVERLGIAKHAPKGQRAYLAKDRLDEKEFETFLSNMPAYAIGREEWPGWKVQFLDQNRAWAQKLWMNLNPQWLRGWLEELYEMPPSHQKLEWNCQGERLNLWKTILQYRPSGLRTKRYTHVPALVAMTTTQVPVVPRSRGEPEAGAGMSRRVRHILPVEALQLQGFPANWKCLPRREMIFQALGNAVHAGLVAEIFKIWFSPRSSAQ